MYASSILFIQFGSVSVCSEHGRAVSALEEDRCRLQKPAVCNNVIRRATVRSDGEVCNVDPMLLSEWTRA